MSHAAILQKEKLRHKEINLLSRHTASNIWKHVDIA